MARPHSFARSRAVRIFVVAFVLNAAVAHRSTVVAADTLRTVALSGDEAPGLGPGAFIGYIDTAFPLENGRVGFGSNLTGPAIKFGIDRNSFALWNESDSGLKKIVQRGDVAPGAPGGARFGGRLNPLPSQMGSATTFAADFVGNSGGQGIWQHSSNRELEQIVFLGNPAPGFADARIRIVRFRDYYSIPVVNGLGQVAFAGEYYGPGVVGGFNYGSWIQEADGEPRLVARSGDPVPGMPTEFVMEGRFQNLQLSDNGRLVMSADIREYESPDRIGTFDRRKVLLSENGAGTLELIAFEGQPAPGVGGDAVFLWGPFLPMDNLAVNRLGKVAFAGQLEGSEVNANNSQGIWTDRTGELTLVARSGDPAPGLNAGERWSAFSALSINDRDEIAFTASYREVGNRTTLNGIWMEQPGGLELVTKEGDMLPGISTGAVFDYGRLYPGGSDVAALTLSLSGAAVDDTNDYGIWARNAIGELLPVARKGDLLDVSDDPSAPDPRKIRSLLLGGIDNLGYISFTAHFIDGSSGVFVSSIVAVPEPATVLMLAVLAPVPFFVRRHAL